MKQVEPKLKQNKLSTNKAEIQKAIFLFNSNSF